MSSRSQQSKPPQGQQVLEFTKGHQIAFVVLMAIGGWTDYHRANRADVPVDILTSERPIVIRVADEIVPFPYLGIEIEPTKGWSYLKVYSRKASREFRFSNPSKGLVVGMARFQFPPTPPGNEMFGDFKTVVDKEGFSNRPRTTSDPAPVQYSDFKVEWFLTANNVDKTVRYGRLETTRGGVLIRVFLLDRKFDDVAENALGDLLNKVAPL